MKETGVFYGVGVGPGDPELITIKAERLIRKADILLLPAKDKDSCHAYRIAAEAVPEIAEKECLFYPFPMVMDKEKLAAFHRELATAVEERLNCGEDVVFLTIGDPSVYSTYSYIRAILQEEGYRCEMIPGINSFTAVAARLGIALGDGSEEIHVIPGSTKLQDTMNLPGTRIYMKSGKKLQELLEALREEQKRKDLQIYSVSNCGMENEVIARSLEEISVEAGYLTIVVVKTVK